MSNDKIPIAFVRAGDNQRMSINHNGTYSWDHQKSDPKHLIYEYNIIDMKLFVNNNSFYEEYE